MNEPRPQFTIVQDVTPADRARQAAREEASEGARLNDLIATAVTPAQATADGFASISTPFNTYFRDSRHSFLRVIDDVQRIPYRIVKISVRSYEVWRLKKDLRIDANSDERQRQERLKKH